VGEFKGLNSEKGKENERLTRNNEETEGKKGEGVD
jgi:hypothetical protein